MTERMIASGALPQQESHGEDATLEDTSLATNGTAHNVATSEATPLAIGSSSTVSASCDHDVTESQNNPASQPPAVVASSNFIWYRSAAVQTLPPNDAKEFQKIYDREPTNQELVSKTGSAAIGRYTAGLSANPYDVVVGSPFATATVSKIRSGYADSSFQTDDVAQCKKALLRAKVKASLLVTKQRDAARSSGLRVWSETRDEYIVHSEQLHINVHFDGQGNAIDANVDGLSLPNISGEEIDPPSMAIESAKPKHHERQHLKAEIGKQAKSYTSSATLTLTSPPTPPSASVYSAFGDVSTPQRIRTVEPRVPSEKCEPASIEHYGYFHLVPRKALDECDNRNEARDKEQQDLTRPEVSGQAAMREGDEGAGGIGRHEDTVMAISGESFADKYIVYDATASSPENSMTTSDVHSTSSRKRKSEDRWETDVATSSPKRSKISDTRTNSLEFRKSTIEDHFAQHQDNFVGVNDAEDTEVDCVRLDERLELAESQQGPASPSNRTCDNEQNAEDDRRSCSFQTQRKSRGRSRSPVDRQTRDRYRSRNQVRRQSENPYEEERRRHKVVRETDDDLRIYGGIDAAYTDKQDQLREVRESDKQKKDVDEIVLARKLEGDRRQEREQRAEEEKLAKRRQLKEAEIQRAREAKNRRKSEIEEKKQAQDADRKRRQEDRDRDRRRRRGDSEDGIEKEDRQALKREAEASESVDAYAVARKAEANRRERAFAARETGETDIRGSEWSLIRKEGPSRPEVERPKPEKKAENGKVTKPKPNRTVRGELERYDPRKKFGGGK